MKPLRIIIVMVEPPLPFGNAAARWYYVLLKGLVERGHKVTAFATCSKPEEIAKAQQLFPAPAYDLRCYAHPVRSGFKAKWETLRQPYSYMFAPKMKRDLVLELDKGFSILHLEQLWSGWMGQQFADRSLLNVHHLVSIDLENVKPKSWRQSADFKMMFGSERKLLRSFRNIRSCSPRLVEDIQRLNPEAQITTVPVGLDSTLYPYIKDEERGSRPTISVIGSMGWYPSRSAAERFLTRLWPAIKAQVPNAVGQVIGWTARTALAKFVGMPDVVIEENVPDIQPYFRNTSVLLYAPERGSGMKIKILEALAFGVPVVTTHEGSEGLPAQDGIHAGVCDDDPGLIERAVKLLKCPESQNRQRAAGRALLESHCGAKSTLDQIESIYAQILESEKP